MTLNQFTSFVLALIVAVALAFIAFLIYFYFLVLFFSPVDSDGHVLMPMGQIFFSILLAVITGGFLFIYFYKKIKKI